METLRHQQIQFVPVVHGRVTFAEQVRRAALAWRPDLIAVELPATLKPWIEEGLERLPEITAVCWEEPPSPGALQAIPIDPCDGLIEAARLGLETQVPVAYIDLDLTGAREAWSHAPDDLIIDKTGLERYVQAVAPLLSSAPDDLRSQAREAHMARCLARLAAEAPALDGAARPPRLLCALGLAHYRGVRRLLLGGADDLPVVIEEMIQSAPRERPGALLARLDPDSVGNVLIEMPWMARRYEIARRRWELTGEAGFDKLAVIDALFRHAAKKYEKKYREQINLTRWRGLFQYARNLAMAAGRLRPGIYEVVCAARGVVDGDFGWEVHDLARAYPPQGKTPQAQAGAGDGADGGLPTLRVENGRARLEGREERFRVEPRRENPPTETITIGLRRRRPPAHLRAKWKESWKREFDGKGLCSWPPEDQTQERFMAFVRKRALQRVGEDRERVVAFSGSMLDGLDARETARNWHAGKLYVRQAPRLLGGVGSVVIIFEDEPLDHEDSWRATLYAENQNESDISFFASPLGQDVVGPRISRTRFGGILSVWPAWGIPDAWSFEVVGHAHWASDVLVTAGVLFSPERYVAVVAPRPPSPRQRELARASGKEIVYLPLATFSRERLRRVRRFHVLGGRDARAWARDYIDED